MTLFAYLISFLFVWPSVATICLLGIAIMSSLVSHSLPRYYLTYRTSPCHIRPFSSSPLLSRSGSPGCAVAQSPTMWVLLSFDLPHGQLCAPSPFFHPGHRSTSVFSSGRSRSPTRKRSCFQGVTRGPSGRATTFSFRSLASAPRTSLNILPHSTSSLSASLSLAPILCFGSVLYPPKFAYIYGQYIFSDAMPRRSFHIFSTALSRLIPARVIVAFSHTALSAIVAGSLCFFLYVSHLSCHSTLSRLHL